jgi:hypothetical protein
MIDLSTYLGGPQREFMRWARYERPYQDLAQILYVGVG